MLHFRPLLCVTVLVAICAMFSGCGPKNPETFPVSGTVTLDSKPVAGAAVVFTPANGQKATGTTDGAGRFELSTFELGDGAVPGEHGVTVVKTTVDPDDQEKVVFLVPMKYGNPQTSELTCDVREEMDPVQFDLPLQPQPDPEQDQPAEVPVPPESEEPSPY